MESYSIAVQAGISPVDFWSLTPYLTKSAIPALINGKNTLAWMTAALSRAKKLPRLDSLMSRRSDGVNVHAKLKEIFTDYNANIKKSRRKANGR